VAAAAAAFFFFKKKEKKKRVEKTPVFKATRVWVVF